MDNDKTWTEAERRDWADNLNASEAAMSDFDLLCRYGRCWCGAPRMALAEGHGRRDAPRRDVPQRARRRLLSVDTDRIVELARQLVLGATPFISAWEFEPDQPGGVDGAAVHRELRQLLGVSYEEWGRSPSR